MVMMVDFKCGYCESHLVIEADDDASVPVWDMAHRYAKAHESHGFIVPIPRTEENLKRHQINRLKDIDND